MARDTHMNGFVNFLKPAGITSHDAVLWFRRLSGDRKVGHLGTLDPMATGVLPLALGSARKLTEYLVDKDKEYVADFTFGVTTDTGDMTGNVLSRKESPHLSEDMVRAALGSLTGRILQVPPAFSAVKVGGRKLYELARKGEVPQARPREVVVYEFSLLRWRRGAFPVGTFHLRVGKGTYVRALAETLGNTLGTGAVVSRLERTRVGPFRIEDGYTPEALAGMKVAGRLDAAVVPATRCLPEFPECVVSPELLRLVAGGTPLAAHAVPTELRESLARSEKKLFFFVDQKGNPLALARLDEKGIRYEKMLTGARDGQGKLDGTRTRTKNGGRFGE